MSRIQDAALLALSVLALAASPAFAQRFAIPDPGPRSSSIGAVNEDGGVAICGTSGGGSRIKESNCEVETTTLRTEMEFKLAIAIPEILSAQCAATTTTEYQQMDTAAHIDGKLEIADCKTASGAFKVAIRVEDASGAEKLLEFEETWRRNDNEDVAFAGDYPIGEDTELVSVRVRGLTCTCADLPNDE
jgi:hypothetical protein